MKRRGVTLIELLTSAVIVGIVVVALSSAFAAAVRYQVEAPRSREAALRRIYFEDSIRQILRRAYVTPDPEDALTFFIGGTNEQDTSALETQQAADQIIFTTIGKRPSTAYLETQETDFTVLNETYGPEGGISEVSLSTVPVGDAGDSQGVFLREQRPSDGDPTQGGYESLLNADVSSIGFEFFDGTTWQAAWDTTTESRRLPSAVRVTYRFFDQPDDIYVFVVNLPHSDVTPNEPYDPSDTGDQGTTGGTTGGATTGGGGPLP